MGGCVEEGWWRVRCILDGASSFYYTEEGMEEIPTSFRLPGLGMDALLIVHPLLPTRKKKIP
jgi:hypothetical protein